MFGKNPFLGTLGFDVYTFLLAPYYHPVMDPMTPIRRQSTYGAGFEEAAKLSPDLRNDPSRLKVESGPAEVTLRFSPTACVLNYWL